MPEPIPPIPNSLLLFLGLGLKDETIPLGLVVGLNFVGERQTAIAVPLPDGKTRGVVLAKAENGIGTGNPSSAYFESEGTFTTPLHTGTSGSIVHSTVSLESNIYATGTASSSEVTVDATGTYYMSMYVEGSATSSLCGAAIDENFFSYRITFNRYNSSDVLQNTVLVGGVTSFAQCYLSSNMVSEGSTVLFMNPGDYIETIVQVYERLGFCSSSCDTPSTSGLFRFQMQRVSLGT